MNAVRRIKIILVLTALGAISLGGIVHADTHRIRTDVHVGLGFGFGGGHHFVGRHHDGFSFLFSAPLYVPYEYYYYPPYEYTVVPPPVQVYNPPPVQVYNVPVKPRGQPRDESYIYGVPIRPRQPEAKAESKPKSKASPLRSTLSQMLGGAEQVNQSFAAGEHFLRLGKPEAAIEKFTNSQTPNESATFLALGLAYFDTGDFETAAAAVREGLASHPNPEAIRINPELVFGDKTRFEKQMAALTAKLGQKDENPSLHLLAGFLYFATGDWARATESLQIAEALDQTDQASARLRALAMKHLQRERSETQKPAPAAAPGASK